MTWNEVFTHSINYLPPERLISEDKNSKSLAN